MDEAGLSDRERRILSEIESELQGEQELERRLRTMRGHGQRSMPRMSRVLSRVRPGVRRPNGLVVCVLALASLVLLIAASLTVSPALIWVFAGTWTLTVVTAVPLIGRRWQERRSRRPQDRGDRGDRRSRGNRGNRGDGGDREDRD